MPNKKIIFLDRDGVINEEVGYLHKIKDFKFIDGVFEACLDYQQNGYQIIIITNQSGIGRGYYQASDFQTVTNWMLTKFKQYGINILEVFYCPHAPEDRCECRKPKAGLLIKAHQKYGIDFANSWMIGDKEADIIAANLAGIDNTILVQSGHIIDPVNSKAKFILKSIQETLQIIQ